MKSKKQFERLLSRRIMGEQGEWLVFCRVCGHFKPVTEFYKRTDSKWGVDSRCKEHYKSYKKKTDEPEDPEMSYLKLDNIKESDFQNVQEFLTQLGFSFQTEKTIHEQFMDKYKLKLKITKK
jgi:hypothetical protein